MAVIYSMKAFDDIRNKIVCGLVAVLVGWRLMRL